MTREEAIKLFRKEIECLSHDHCSDCILEKVCDPMKTPLDSEYMEAMSMAIEALSTSEIPNKWIPASEPPKKEGKYLVCIEYKHKGVVVERYQMTADFYRFSHIDMSWCPDNENAAGDIVAWRELPEPYKAESEDKE